MTPKTTMKMEGRKRRRSPSRARQPRFCCAPNGLYQLSSTARKQNTKSLSQESMCPFTDHAVTESHQHDTRHPYMRTSQDLIDTRPTHLQVSHANTATRSIPSARSWEWMAQ
jgi:hypothetical protein